MDRRRFFIGDPMLRRPMRTGISGRTEALSRREIGHRHKIRISLSRSRAMPDAVRPAVHLVSCSKQEITMPTCDVCGNEYDKTFQVVRDGETHTFDSFECAIHALAPECAHCHCKIIGHGTEANGAFYCCAHCAGHAGQHEMRDRSETRAT
jgi:hypothetical protein